MSAPLAHPAARSVVGLLGLRENPNGGWFRLTHECRPDPEAGGGRSVATVIAFLVEAHRPAVRLHRMTADAVHYFHQGCPLVVVTISPDGELTRTVLGDDVAAGQRLQVVVPGGWWKGFELGGGPWSLIGEAVAPGWESTDDEVATAADLLTEWPHLRGDIEHLVADGRPRHPGDTVNDEMLRGQAPVGDLRTLLGLEPNLEGGYYRQTFESYDVTPTTNGPRPLLNSIYYLLTADSPIGYLHMNRSAITHFHHVGGPSTYLLVSPSGELQDVALGPDLARGQVVSFTCPGGWWKASHVLAPGATDCLISEAVAPGFRYEDHRMATTAEITARHPSVLDRLTPFILG